MVSSRNVSTIENKDPMTGALILLLVLLCGLILFGEMDTRLGSHIKNTAIVKGKECVMRECVLTVVSSEGNTVKIPVTQRQSLIIEIGSQIVYTDNMTAWTNCKTYKIENI